MKKLESKCTIKVESHTDIQIMDLKKDFKFVDAEYSGILDNILKLAESNLSRYEETKIFLKLFLNVRTIHVRW